MAITVNQTCDDTKIDELEDDELEDDELLLDDTPVIPEAAKLLFLRLSSCSCVTCEGMQNLACLTGSLTSQLTQSTMWLHWSTVPLSMPKANVGAPTRGTRIAPIVSAALRRLDITNPFSFFDKINVMTRLDRRP